LVPKSITIHKASAQATLQDYNEPSGIVIKNGQILTGRLSKPMLGAANTGIIHAIWRLYGGPGAHKFISDAQRMFVSHLMHDGPTQSIVDCLMGSEHDIQGILQKHLKRADDILTLKDLPVEVREAKSSSILQETLRAVGSSMLQSLRPTSGLANCVQSGSKGNQLNIAQIGGCVGQQTIYGRRVPMRKTRLGLRTLCCFSPNDFRAETRGFVSNSYITGLTPAEMFMHQMAGREGIVATAVNTSESGYNQRRMIKGQESQCLGYDGTVRVSSNIIIQTVYGGDDLDGSRLERVRLGNWILTDVHDSLSAFVKASRMLVLKHAAYRANFFRSWDPVFPCGILLQPLVENEKSNGLPIDLRGNLIDRILRGILKLHARHHTATRPILTISTAVACLQLAEFSHVLTEVHMPQILQLYSKALVAPGEGVGALGATSIGEPSMQMTLNVFHYSGIADKNVTITGLPRFKQLINSVDTYETANMTAELRDFDLAGSALQISVVMLSDVMQSSTEPKIVKFVSGTSAFEPLGTQRGPFAAKFGTHYDFTDVKDPEAEGQSWSFDIVLSWSKCAQRQVTTSQVSKSLRECFSFDALVIAQPHWSEPRIRIIFAPWITNVEPIVEGLLFQHQIRGISYVKNAIVLQDTKYLPTGTSVSRHIVETEGSNILDLAKCSLLVPETIRTSNVVELAGVLGISAGIAVLQAELHKVLSFDSSYIDPRHTWLLADTMGRSGNLAAMNRHHMETMGSSLLQRASFEQSLTVFEEGACFGRSDPLAGATERIITGQPVSIGTGMVGILLEQDHEQAGDSTMVGPMNLRMPSDMADSADMAADSVETAVMPMAHGSHGSKNQTFFQAGNYSSRITDASKVAQNEFLETCVTRYRECAAQRRLFPMLEFELDLTRTAYDTILRELQSYEEHWTHQEFHSMVQQVEWVSDTPEWTGFTKLFGIEAVPTSILKQVFYQDVDTSEPKYKARIFAEKSLSPTEVPFGVKVLQVTMSEMCIFQKGLFQVCLAKSWTAETNTEAEAKILQGLPRLSIVLSTFQTEAILQTRCSDAQLANALLERLPNFT
jgi:DNA-directed RNA polymerase II subunit RPB1